MRVTQLLKKQLPYPYTRGAQLMSVDWNFVFGKSYYARGLMLSFLFGAIPAFFAMRKIEIAFHDKCKANEAAQHAAAHAQEVRKAVPEGWKA